MQRPVELPLASLDASVRDPGLALCVREGGRIRERVGREVPSALAAFLDAPGPRLLGADAPLGVPAAWARRAGITSFRGLICQLRESTFAALLEPARWPEEVSARRPFLVPPKGARLAGLAARLGLAPQELLRRCDHLARAHPLFWCTGPRQVGRAAARFWREVLRPRWCAGRIAVWPFDGPLAALLEAGRPVVVELYPTLVRRAFATFAARAVGLFGADVAARLEAVAARRIGRGDLDDARFGLLQLEAFLRDPAEPPGDPPVRTLEGWIAGLAAPAGS